MGALKVNISKSDILFFFSLDINWVHCVNCERYYHSSNLTHQKVWLEVMINYMKILRKTYMNIYMNIHVKIKINIYMIMYIWTVRWTWSIFQWIAIYAHIYEHWYQHSDELQGQNVFCLHVSINMKGTKMVLCFEYRTTSVQ